MNEQRVSILTCFSFCWQDRTVLDWQVNLWPLFLGVLYRIGSIQRKEIGRDERAGSQVMAESKDELKSLFMKVKEESERVGLKLSIQKMKIMASSPITSWQRMEIVTNFIFSDSKITADGDYSHEIKIYLLLGRKAVTKLDRLSESRDITLPTKVCLVKDMVVPVGMCGCESWTIKKAEHQRIDAFEL